MKRTISNMLGRPEYCKKYNKTIYKTLKSAQGVLNSIKSRRGKSSVTRYYKCDVCNGYHLTHLTLDEQQDIENAKEETVPLILQTKWEKLLKNQTN